MPFADLALTRRVEEAWDWIGVENARVQMRLDPQSGATALSVGGGHAVFLGAGSPLSQAQGLGLYGPVAESEIERMEEFFRKRGTVTQIEVASLADPSLLVLLSRRGYQILEQTHLLVLPLEPGQSFPAEIEAQPGSDGHDGRDRPGFQGQAGRDQTLGRGRVAQLLRGAGRAARLALGRSHCHELDPLGDRLDGPDRRPACRRRLTDHSRRPGPDLR